MWNKKFALTNYTVKTVKTDAVLGTVEKQCVEFAKFYFGARKTDCFYEATTSGINTFYVREPDTNVAHIVAKVSVLDNAKAKAKPLYKVENWYTDAKFLPKGKDGTRTEKLFALV